MTTPNDFSYHNHSYFTDKYFIYHETSAPKTTCIFGEESYNEGETVPLLCYHIICTSGIWVHTGMVNNRCRKARVYWDPHVKTFDNKHYNYHKPCNFSLVQPGLIQTPKYGVYAQFAECIGLGTCIEKIVFKDNNNTVITISVRNKEELTVFLNGKEFPVSSDTPSFMVQDGVQHPVLAWSQTGSNSRLLFAGSSNLVLEVSKNHVFLWLHPSLTDHYGLCGTSNGVQDDEFTTRSGNVVNSLTSFADSWMTDTQTSPECLTSQRFKRNIILNETGLCTLGNDTLLDLEAICRQKVPVVQHSGQVVEAAEVNALMEACTFDLCLLYSNTGGNMTAIEEYIDTVIADVVVRIIEIEADLIDVESLTTIAPPNTTIARGRPKRRRTYLKIEQKVYL
ncbi:mucin-19-like [Penaeus indicus]|uniref:mucin-19-like n=1 Tax=Penaeus indicus TaxID=29960 RepID=UPI00300CD112